MGPSPHPELFTSFDKKVQEKQSDQISAEDQATQAEV